MSKPNITILGSGTSTGVPMISCNCRVCNSNDIRDKRFRASIFIQSKQAKIIIDTGPDLRAQCLRENISQLDAVLFTHAHIDHIAGFDDLRRFTFGNKFLPIYAIKHTLAELKKIFPYCFCENSSFTNKVKTYLKVKEHKICGKFIIKDIEFEPLRVMHAKIPTIGFKIFFSNGKTCAYIPDCKEIESDTLKKIKNLDVLIIDALHHREHRTHVNFEQATEISKKLKPKQTYFTHLSHEIFHKSDEKKLSKNIYLAYDGLKIHLF